MRVAISVGHGFGYDEMDEYVCDPGAVNEKTGITESEAVGSIRNALRPMLRYSPVEVVEIPRCSLEERIQRINAEHKQGFIELVIEIHLNAPPPPVDVEINGTEVWYYPGSVLGNLAAQHLLAALTKTLGFRSRNLCSTHELPFLAETKPAAVLTEAAFITHDPVAIALDEGSLIPRIAWGHALGIWNFAEAIQMKEKNASDQ